MGIDSPSLGDPLLATASLPCSATKPTWEVLVKLASLSLTARRHCQTLFLLTTRVRDIYNYVNVLLRQIDDKKLNEELRWLAFDTSDLLLEVLERAVLELSNLSPLHFEAFDSENFQGLFDTRTLLKRNLEALFSLHLPNDSSLDSSSQSVAVRYDDRACLDMLSRYRNSVIASKPDKQAAAIEPVYKETCQTLSAVVERLAWFPHLNDLVDLMINLEYIVLRLLLSRRSDELLEKDWSNLDSLVRRAYALVTRTTDDPDPDYNDLADDIRRESHCDFELLSQFGDSIGTATIASASNSQLSAKSSAVSAKALVPFVKPRVNYNRTQYTYNPLATRQGNLKRVQGAIEYIQDFISSNQWASAEFLARFERLRAEYETQVEEVTKAPLMHYLTDQDGRRDTKSLLEMAQDLAKNLNDIGTRRTLDSSREKLNKGHAKAKVSGRLALVQEKDKPQTSAEGSAVQDEIPEPISLPPELGGGWTDAKEGNEPFGVEALTEEEVQRLLGGL